MRTARPMRTCASSPRAISRSMVLVETASLVAAPSMSSRGIMDYRKAPGNSARMYAAIIIASPRSADGPGDSFVDGLARLSQISAHLLAASASAACHASHAHSVAALRYSPGSMRSMVCPSFALTDKIHCSNRSRLSLIWRPPIPISICCVPCARIVCLVQNVSKPCASIRQSGKCCRCASRHLDN